MDDRNHRAELLDLLQRLNHTEMVVLNERWAGRTSSEIAGVLGISQSAARAHLGNIYDKLEVTYVRTGTSLGRIMAFYAVVDDPPGSHTRTVCTRTSLCRLLSRRDRHWSSFKMMTTH